jgi:hypothetical protein
VSSGMPGVRSSDGRRAVCAVISDPLCGRPGLLRGLLLRSGGRVVALVSMMHLRHVLRTGSRADRQDQRSGGERRKGAGERARVGGPLELGEHRPESLNRKVASPRCFERRHEAARAPPPIRRGASVLQGRERRCGRTRVALSLGRGRNRMRTGRAPRSDSAAQSPTARRSSRQQSRAGRRFPSQHHGGRGLVRRPSRDGDGDDPRSGTPPRHDAGAAPGCARQRPPPRSARGRGLRAPARPSPGQAREAGTASAKRYRGPRHKATRGRLPRGRERPRAKSRSATRMFRRSAA